MAKPNDALAQRQRKQKIFLAIGGVILAALLAIQGPKLFKQLNGSGSTAPAPAASTEGSTSSTTAGSGTTSTSTTAGSGTTSTSTETSTPTPVAAKGAAILVGVPVNPSAAPEPEEGQLWSFSRFEAKDPFEQNVSLETATPTGSSGSSSSSSSGSGSGGSSSGSSGGGATPKPQATKAQPAAPSAVGGIVLGGGTGGVGAAPEAPATHATIAVNGKPEPLEVKDVFPKADKAFVLVGLKDKTAKIGVAGGSFTGGGTVSLELGKQVTLVDTATGARYVLRLLYVGSGPEQIEKFSSGEKK